MANLITLSRFFLLVVVIVMALAPASPWQFLNTPLLVLVFVLDGLDGYVARHRGEESLFGALFDIAMDRIVENVLWLVLAVLGLVPVWVPVLFLARGSLVDAIRAYGSSLGQTPFGMMRSSLGQFLVAGRFMRVFYAGVKAVTFCWLFLLQPVPALYPEFWDRWALPLQVVSGVLIFSSVATCLARGIPVVAEFIAYEIEAERAR